MTFAASLASSLASTAADPAGRRWLFVPEDQLNDGIGPLARESASTLGVVIVESHWKAGLRPYHRQRLATIWANQRHFALEQARRGVAVRYVIGRASHAEVLAPLCAELGPLRMMEAAERELRVELAPLVADGRIEVMAHEGWLSTREDFLGGAGATPPWRMDRFYRRLRQKTGWLMEGARPIGGRYSFDVENREPWRGDPPAPDPPRLPIDAIKTEVAALVEREFAAHPGAVDPGAIAATKEDAQEAWRWARREALPHFGPHEDAFSTRSSTLFHSRLSTLLNLHRLLPREVVEEVVAMDLPLASQEGFVRQVLGWREFVRHVHRETDGLRRIPGIESDPCERPGDAGYARWSGRPWVSSAGDLPDGGASASLLGADAPLPVAFWGAPSGLACLDHVVSDVWREAWSHHITRLMVLGNLASLLDVSPRELTDWFWVAYTDAWDWVVEPNVMGMATYALGGVMTTKPYVSGTPYLQRMGDACAGCAFDPKRDCPISALYWAYLERHRTHFEGNPRMTMPLRSLARRGPGRREADARVFAHLRSRLGRGEPVTPASLQGALAASSTEEDER